MVLRRKYCRAILILLLVAFMQNEERQEERIDRELDARDAARQLN